MQLSSVFLSATALLAHTAFGVYLTSDQNDYGADAYAVVKYPRIGFYSGPQSSPANIRFDRGGNLIPAVSLRKVGDMWRLEFQPEGYEEPGSIRGPFVFIDDELVYADGHLVWYLCGVETDRDILLGAPGSQPPSGEECIEDVTIRIQ